MLYLLYVIGVFIYFPTNSTKSDGSERSLSSVQPDQVDQNQNLSDHLVASRFGEIDNVQRLANDQRQLLNEARAQNVDQYRQLNWSSTFQNCASSDIFGNEANHEMVWAQLLNIPFECELNPTAYSLLQNNSNQNDQRNKNPKDDTFDQLPNTENTIRLSQKKKFDLFQEMLRTEETPPRTNKEYADKLKVSYRQISAWKKSLGLIKPQGKFELYEELRKKNNSLVTREYAKILKVSQPTICKWNKKLASKKNSVDTTQ